MSAPVFPGNTSSAVFSIPPTHNRPPTKEDSMTSSKYESVYHEHLLDPKSGKVIGINQFVTPHASKYGYWKFSPLDHRTQTEAYKIGYSRPEEMLVAYKNGACGRWADEIALIWYPGELEVNKTPLIASISKHMATIARERSLMEFSPIQKQEVPVYALSHGNKNILKVRSATMYTAPLPAEVYIPPMTQVFGQPSNAPHQPSGPFNLSYGGSAAGPSHLTTDFHGFSPNTPTFPQFSSDMSGFAEYLFNPSKSLPDLLGEASSTLPEFPPVGSPSTLSAGPSGPSSPFEINLNSSATLPIAEASASVTSGTINPHEVTMNLSDTLPNERVSAQVNSGTVNPDDLMLDSGAQVTSGTINPAVLTMNSDAQVNSGTINPAVLTLNSNTQVASGTVNPADLMLDSSAQVTSGTINPAVLTLDSNAQVTSGTVNPADLMLRPSAQVTSGTPSTSQAASNSPATPQRAELSARGLSPLFDQPSSGVPAPDLEPILGQPWDGEWPAPPLSDAEVAAALGQQSRWGHIFNMNTGEWLEDLPGY